MYWMNVFQSEFRSVLRDILVRIGCIVLCFFLGFALQSVSVPGSTVPIGILGISPYLTAVFLARLFCVLIPSFAAAQRGDSAAGLRVRNLAFRLGIVLSLLFSSGFVFSSGASLCGQTLFAAAVLSVVSIALMFFCRLLDVFFFQEGLSVFLLFFLLSFVPEDVRILIPLFKRDPCAVLVLFLFVLFVWLSVSYKKQIPLVCGREEGSVSRTLSFRLFPGGILPVAFVLVLKSLFSWIGQRSGLFFLDSSQWFSSERPGAAFGVLVYFALIFFFSRYSQILYSNEYLIADRLEKESCVLCCAQADRNLFDSLRVELFRLNRHSAVLLCLIFTAQFLIGFLYHIPDTIFTSISLIFVCAGIRHIFLIGRTDWNRLFLFLSVR